VSDLREPLGARAPLMPAVSPRLAARPSRSPGGVAAWVRRPARAAPSPVV